MAASVGAKAWPVAFLAALVAILYREGREPTGPPGELQTLHLDAEEAVDEEASALLQSRLRQVGALNILEPTPAPVEKPVDADCNVSDIATGSWGFDISGMMANVEPGRDFNEYANGNWLNRTSIPPDQGSMDQFVAVTAKVTAEIRGLLEQGAKDGTDPGLFYKSFMDEELVEQLGVKPLQPTLDRVRQIEDHQQFAAFAGATKFGFGSTLFSVEVNTDLKDSAINVVRLGQGGIGLPGPDYYSQPRFAETKAAYQKHVARMLGLAGWTDPAQAASDVVAFEEGIAKVLWDAGKMRDAGLSYNKMAVADLSSHLPGFHWEAFMQGAGVPQNATVNICAFNQTAHDGVAGIVDLVNSTDIGALRAWAATNVVRPAATYLPKAFADAEFDFQRTLSGQAEIEPRSKTALRTVSGLMGDDVGKQYVQKFFPESTRAAVKELVGFLHQAFEQRLRASAWMSDVTKQRALTKLAALKFETGYPEKWKEYAGAAMNGSDLYGNMEKALANQWNFNRAQIGRPVDHSYWTENPQTVNSAYLQNQNRIMLQAAMMQPPFYNPLGDMAVNFGAFGAVIGHEITHGFDDSGRKYDEHGGLEDWWTPADAAEFERRAKAFGEQYANYTTGLPAGMHIRPGLTMGENLGDLGGLSFAHEALQLWLRNHTYEARPPFIGSDSDGHEIDRRFFLGWAQAYRSKFTEAALEQRLTTNPHPPGMARVAIPPRNIDAWYSAFNIKPGDPLYLDKADRAQIW